MSGETEICEVSGCKNLEQVTVSQEGSSKQKRVCQECVMIVMSMMEADE